MATAAKILNIDPAYGIAGGEIVIDCEGFDTSDPSRCGVTIGEAQAQIVALGPHRVLAVVPETKGGKVEVRLSSNGELSEPASLTVAKKLAGDLHPVANPAFDPDDGALFVTRSGSRGEELPVTLFRIDISGDVSEYSGDISNPTGIAFSPTFIVPSLVDLALMAASGLIGGTALLVLIAAYRRSPAALVAPFQYSQMIWAILLGALLWGDLPEPAMLLGASIVAGSGLFVLYRETALGRRPTASLHPNAAAPKPIPTAT